MQVLNATKQQKRIAQRLRQLHDIDRDPPRLIFAERLCCRLLKFHLRHDPSFGVTRVTAPSYPNL